MSENGGGRGGNSFEDPLAWVDPHKLAFDYAANERQRNKAVEEAGRLQEILNQEKKTAARWRTLYEEWKLHDEGLQAFIENAKKGWNEERAQLLKRVEVAEMRVAQAQHRESARVPAPEPPPPLPVPMLCRRVIDDDPLDAAYDSD